MLFENATISCVGTFTNETYNNMTVFVFAQKSTKTKSVTDNRSSRRKVKGGSVKKAAKCEKQGKSKK